MAENDNENIAPNGESDAAQETAPLSGEALLNAENEALRIEIAAQKDRVLRTMADMENLRKRAEREKQDAAAYAMTKFARDMLSVADNLNRALAAAPPEARNADPALKSVFEGVGATERELQAILARHSVKPINPAGEKFDPHLHQAIAEVPAPGQAPGTVVAVVQTGYLIGDRLLRPAMVTVAKSDGSTTGANVDQRV